MLKTTSIMAALVLLWAQALAAQTQDFHVIGVDTSHWPEIHLTAALPEGEKAPDDYTLLLTPYNESATATRINGPLSNDPTSLVVAVDTSHSLSPDRLNAAKEALGAYVDQLESGEQIALLGFNDNVQLASGFTGNRDVFKRNLEALYLGGSKTELYRSLLYGVEILKNLPGRHHLLVLSDGFDEGSGITLEQVVQRAQENNIKISAIGVPGLPAASGDRHLENLKALAGQTGGVYQEARSPEDMNTGIHSLLDQQKAMARQERGRIFDLAFDMSGQPPRTAVNADLMHSNPNGTRSASFYLPPPPADMVALASGYQPWTTADGETGQAGSEMPSLDDRNPGLLDAENIAALNGTEVDVIEVEDQPARDLENEMAVSASADSDAAGAYGVTTTEMAVPFWQRPFFWLLVALALGAYAYYYWRHRLSHVEAAEAVAYRPEDFNYNTVAGGFYEGEPSPYSLEFPETGQSIPLHQGVISVGSSPNNHIVLEEITVSPRHAEIHVTGDELAIRNLNSINQTTINGDPVPTRLISIKPGDKLLIGRTVAFFPPDGFQPLPWFILIQGK